MDKARTDRVWRDHVNEPTKMAIANAAYEAYALAQVHAGNEVLEKQSKLGPGSTAESHRDAELALGRHVEAIRSALAHGEQELAQIERGGDQATPVNAPPAVQTSATGEGGGEIPAGTTEPEKATVN